MADSHFRWADTRGISFWVDELAMAELSVLASSNKTYDTCHGGDPSGTARRTIDDLDIWARTRPLKKAPRQ